jgi:hypothetical protein
VAAAAVRALCFVAGAFRIKGAARRGGFCPVAGAALPVFNFLRANKERRMVFGF